MPELRSPLGAWRSSLGMRLPLPRGESASVVGMWGALTSGCVRMLLEEMHWHAGTRRAAGRGVKISELKVRPA